MKTKKKTPRKAVTLLTKTETLLNDVYDECAAIEKDVEKKVWALLRSAEASIAAAKDFFTAPAPAKRRAKPAAAAKRIPRHRHAVAKAKPAAPAARKRAVKAVRAVKPRPAAAKREAEAAVPAAAIPVM